MNAKPGSCPMDTSGLLSLSRAMQRGASRDGWSERRKVAKVEARRQVKPSQLVWLEVQE
jgi:hypothetical protein